jgi:hypothetical protein
MFFSSKLRNRKAHQDQRRFRPQLDILEDRAVPATLTVTTPLDIVNPNDGLLSLREAVAAVKGKGTTIAFAGSVNGQTINLTGGQLSLSKDMEIKGPGADLLAISGSQSSRVFEVSSRVKASMSGLTIRDGLIDGQGGGILNRGTLTITNCTLTGSSAVDGGAIHNVGTMILTNCTVSGNLATGAETWGSQHGGGGIFNQGTLTLNGSYLTDNRASAGDGGGIFNTGTLTLKGTTVSFNSAGSVFQLYNGDGIFNDPLTNGYVSILNGSWVGQNNDDDLFSTLGSFHVDATSTVIYIHDGTY